MKNFGCKAVYDDERAADLFRAYRQHLSACRLIKVADVYRSVVDMPAARFWVSPARAVAVMRDIINGDKLSAMRPTKREMFFEIYARVTELALKKKKWTLKQLVEEVISRPAPKFYITPGSARIIILSERKKWHLEKSKKRWRLQ